MEEANAAAACTRTVATDGGLLAGSGKYTDAASCSAGTFPVLTLTTRCRLRVGASSVRTMGCQHIDRVAASASTTTVREHLPWDEDIHALKHDIAPGTSSIGHGPGCSCPEATAAATATGIDDPRD